MEEMGTEKGFGTEILIFDSRENGEHRTPHRVYACSLCPLPPPSLFYHRPIRPRLRCGTGDREGGRRAEEHWSRG